MRRRRARGFTLLEVAVALAILGAGVVTCIQIFSGGLRLQDRATRHVAAVRHARVLMDGLLLEPEPLSGEQQMPATNEGIVAVRRGHPAGPDDGILMPDDDFGEQVIPWIVEVAVTWQDGVASKTYVLRSLRLAQPDLIGDLERLRER
jgi:prepilin-type N-terminal cleavage/methylation domain-containing protein